MSRVSEHFTRSEFACKCGKCDFMTVDVELIMILEHVRKMLNERFDNPVVLEITSGCRCRKHNNRTPGASKNSKHTQGNAADFKAWEKTSQGNRLINPELIYNLIDTLWPDRLGLGLYSNRVHVDTRTKKGRW